MPLAINSQRSIPDADLSIRAVRSSGPGGQNVNKLSTKVQIHFALRSTAALSAEEKARLARSHPRQLTTDGELFLSCDETRSQETNKQRALARLAAWVRAALVKDRPRIQTKPGRGAQRQRLESKKKQAQLKAQRSRRFDSRDD